MVLAKHGRPAVVVMAVEEFERLKALDATATAPADEHEVERIFLIIKEASEY